MSVHTQIREIQEAIDVMADVVSDTQSHIRALWKSYSQLKTRIIQLEKKNEETK